MTMFTIDELVDAVRAIPPSSTKVVEMFAGKCFIAANGDHLLTEEAVVNIVDNWPGCQDGRDKFLKGLGIKREVTLITVNMVEIFQFQGGGIWTACKPKDKGLQRLQDALVGTYRWKQVSANPKLDTKHVSRAYNVVFDAKKLKALTQDRPASLHLITGGWVDVDTNIVGDQGRLSMRFHVGEVHKEKV